MSAVYEKHAVPVEEYVNAFNCGPLQTGLIFVIPGSCIGVDLFDNPARCDGYSQTRPQLRAGCTRSTAPARQAGDPSDAAAKIFEQIIAAPSFGQRAVGIGEEIRVDDSLLSGAALGH